MRLQTDKDNELRRLGLKGSFEASTVNSPVSRIYQKNQELGNARIGLENIGTLGNIEPRVVFRIPIESKTSKNTKIVISETWKLPKQENSYIVASYNLEYPYTTNAFHFCHFGEQFFSTESNTFFKKYSDLLKYFKRFQSNVWKTVGQNKNNVYAKTPLPLRLQKENTNLNELQLSGVSRQLLYGYNDLPFVRISSPISNTSNVYAQRVERSVQLDQVDFTDFSERKSIGYVKLDLNPTGISGFSNYLLGPSGIGTGAASLAQFSRLREHFVWSPTLGSGLTSSDIRLSDQMSGIDLLSGTGAFLSGFHVVYPNTVSLNKAHPVKCDTKISFINNYDENLKINGLLLISTGNRYNGTSKICYVSPHKINPILANTIVDYYKPERFSFERSGNTIVQNIIKKTSDIIQVHALEVTSEFNNFKQEYNNIDNDYNNVNQDFDAIGKNGLVNQNLYSYIDNNPSGTSGTLSISRHHYMFSGSHLQQIKPLSQTPFYKLYNSLYTGSKKINAGTWDGIIPSGTFVTVEFITTTFEKNIGINLDAVQVYKNHGSADSLDQEIIRAFDATNFKDLFGKTKINPNGTLSYNQYATSDSPSASELYAKVGANNMINKLLAKVFRLKIPSIVILNRKFQQLQGLRDRIRNIVLEEIDNSNQPEALQKMPSVYKKEIINYE